MAFLPDLQRRLDEVAAKHDIPGASVAVSQGGEFAEACTGVLNRITGVTTTPDSVFQIGSVTKVWTATLVMHVTFVEGGRYLHNGRAMPRVAS
jgi:CubicO group peptidase (beta-lactamase class C family)